MFRVALRQRSVACRSPSARRGHATHVASRSIALRREDKSVWERRVALTPEAVNNLIHETRARIYVQPSSKRVFGDAEYVKAGAIVQEDISDADIIFGIKEVPMRSLIPRKTYVFFSHTHKGQEYNMRMLQDVLDKEIRLVDYELMTDEYKQRLVMFGRHAGYAGMIDGLHGLGLRLLGAGYNSPFMHIGMSHNYASLDRALAAVQEVGENIAENGLPKEFSPMIFTFTGTGNVAQGAQRIFRNLPHEFVDPNDLKRLVELPKTRTNKVYGCQVTCRDYLSHKETGQFDKQDYYANPNNYVSRFHATIAPYTSFLVHGSYWDSRYPRLLTTRQLANIQSDPQKRFRMLCVSDISCDINGALEFLSHSTTIDNPFYYVDAVNDVEHESMEKEGTQIMAVDILPTEVPLESSQHFSQALYPFVKELIVNANAENPIITRATIAKDGRLSKPHSHLYDLLEKNANSHPPADRMKDDSKRVLLLGSGFVAKPCVDYLAKKAGMSVTIASNALEEARVLARGHEDVKVVGLDVGDKTRMVELIEECDVVVSFVPAPLHPIVAESCIERRKHMVTASYISPAMRALDERAKQVGVAMLNEIGLDPGIDHLSAKKIIDSVTAGGGEITSFISWCGGLPHPDDSHVPLRYKFSWSPRGVLTAALNDARFWMNGKMHWIEGKNLLRQHFTDVKMPGLEGLANRDSLAYLELYGLEPLERMNNMFRGTLRYKGFSDLMHAFVRIGLLDTVTTVNVAKFETWIDFLHHVLFSAGETGPQASLLTAASYKAAIADKIGLPKHHDMVENVVQSFEWLGLVPTQQAVPPLPHLFPRPPSGASTWTSPLDVFCMLLQDRLKYTTNERDMVLLHHEFTYRTRDGGPEETITSTLKEFGTPGGYTAMAKSVGLPAAIAAELVVTGEIREAGVLAPTLPHVYGPILERLECEGIRIEERTGICKSDRMSGQLFYGGSGAWETDYRPQTASSF